MGRLHHRQTCPIIHSVGGEDDSRAETLPSKAEMELPNETSLEYRVSIEPLKLVISLEFCDEAASDDSADEMALFIPVSC